MCVTYWIWHVTGAVVLAAAAEVVRVGTVPTHYENNKRLSESSRCN